MNDVRRFGIWLYLTYFGASRGRKNHVFYGKKRSYPKLMENFIKFLWE